MNNYFAIITNAEKDSQGYDGYTYDMEYEFRAISDELAASKLMKQISRGRAVRPLDKIGVNGFYRITDDDMEPLDNLLHSEFAY